MRKSLTIQRILLLVCLLVGVYGEGIAQKNDAVRYEIDMKRLGVRPTDKDALPRSREFIRLDSTYYVGWLYEGVYKYERSADYLGYKNAIPSLEKALRLLQKDYNPVLKNLFSSLENMSLNINIYQDLFLIANALKDCYDYLERPDKVMELLAEIDSYHFKKDYFGVYYHRAWTYHRNRFYTSAKFRFLKNSVAENEKMAFYWCYYGLGFIQTNKAQNDSWFGPGQSESDKLSIYHYLALLHSYNRNYDSSLYYYQLLAERGAISYNNYALLLKEIGDFSNAEYYFNVARDESFDKNLREPYYYLPELYVYQAKPKSGIRLTQGIISQNGSTPGFGWYNIALARSYLYDGQLDSCQIALDKAANFKEIHIGTTLSQSQYDFALNMLRVMLLDREISQIKFVNRAWWRTPVDLYKIAQYKTEKTLASYVVVNQLANNPERSRIVYDLFCGESTTSFDETLTLLKEFTPAYFIKMYEGHLTSDKRTNIHRYFSLFVSTFKWQQGDYKDAMKGYEALAANLLLDTAAEKLFIARLFEGLAKSYEKYDKKHELQFYKNALYEEYPQLLPFSDVVMDMYLTTSGTADENTAEVIDELKKCNVKWAKSNAGSCPVASLHFNKKGNKYEALINVRDKSGMKTIVSERLIFQKTEGVGKEIGLRLFGKGGKLVWD